MAEQASKHSSERQCALEYWRARLPELPPAPELPLAANPDFITHPEFVRRRHLLPATQWSRLKQRAAEINVTPTVVLLTVFSEVLARWSKHPRFTVSLTSFNRLPLHPDIDKLIGDFTSLILLEIDADANASF